MSQLSRTVTGQSQMSKMSKEGSQMGDSAQLSRMRTNDLYSGFINHLTPQQTQKLAEFKSRLEKTGTWSPRGVNGKPTHDDATLLRYLRARKFEVEGAIGQFTDTEKWMKDNKIENLYEHFDVELYERARSMYPQWTGRRDYRGIPVYVFEIKGLDSKNVAKYQKESEAYKKTLPHHKNISTPAKLLPLFALYHNLIHLILPMCSSLDRQNPEVAITNSCNIVDISGVGLTQFWNLKQHMQDASVLATAHYPETLDRIYIIGAPSFFPTVWSWIKRWFDPVTVSKIFILSRAEVKPTLSKYMSMKDVPRKYGGELDWGWGDLPSLGEAERRAFSTDGKYQWVPGPCLWLDDKRVTVGSVHGKPRYDEANVASMKPVIYRADHTDYPVHAEKTGSMSPVGGVNGAPTKATPASPRSPAATEMAAARAQPASPSTNETSSAQMPATTTTSPTPHQTTASPPPQLQQAATAASMTPSAYSQGQTVISPSGDSKVHVPDAQSARPATTAEYIPYSSETAHTATQPTATTTTTTTTTTAPAPAPAQAPAPSSHTLSSGYHPPPAQPMPGPLSDHTVAINQAIAAKMQGESLSTIPSSTGQNGDIPHPEVIVASDGSKGLAAETEKLQLGARPAMERFVTARDVKLA